MNGYDARKEKWEPMEIKGVNGYFSNFRIDSDAIPDNFHVWEPADNCDGNSHRYK